ncbi:MAG: Hpt domain-containing protein [Rhodospirillales bacterium]|nr:Hpt domain-containing protein [Rhodospirillales bacterium]
MMARLDDDILATLRRKFISDVAARLEAMDDALGRLSSPAPGSEDSLDFLKFESHKLHGSGASFRYAEISRVAGEMEDYLEGSGSDVAVLGPLMGALRASVPGDDDPKA